MNTIPHPDDLKTFVANGQAAQAAVDRVVVTFTASKDGRSRVRSVDPCPFLHQSEVRKFLLEQAGRTRAHKYTRVSGQTMIELNEHVRQWCITRVARLPSMGRTI